MVALWVKYNFATQQFVRKHFGYPSKLWHFSKGFCFLKHLIVVISIKVSKCMTYDEIDFTELINLKMFIKRIRADDIPSYAVSTYSRHIDNIKYS